ncbi:LOW QUALITY PROTEIN: hypothetical protein OSB04_017707 [Centaurea solstitialis]|uniref:UDP-glycosyltransferase n=1 Tax=Centaurea solstitialis TaxID=347529 RepID=A0AA38TLG7_9ASTR|nr:LOW QUALITY PROTEIN: hypothetical protein OSB04_017707 [Centaurea solstitialis]
MLSDYFGLQINLSKSKLYGVVVEVVEIQEWANDIGCDWGFLPLLYLGLPIAPDMNHIQSWSAIVEKMKKKLTSRKARALSSGGRLTLVNSVLSILMLHYFSLFRASRGVILEMIVKLNVPWERLEPSLKPKILRCSPTPTHVKHLPKYLHHRPIPLSPQSSTHHRHLTIIAKTHLFQIAFGRKIELAYHGLTNTLQKTVLYVSFESLSSTARLINYSKSGMVSGKSFLWVRRPGSITGGYDQTQLPSEIIKRTKEMGFIIDWAPQEEVLVYRAVGVFLTHSGWNSTLESIMVGVPMICWLFYVDQLGNSCFVEEVWKVGVDIKDTCNRLIVEKVIRNVMDVKRDMFTRSVSLWVNHSKELISETDLLTKSLNRLIDDIRLMTYERHLEINFKC